MSLVPVVTEIEVENFVFPPAVTPPASGNAFFLGGAGVRGLYIEGEFKKFTAIGVYLESKAVPLLAAKWSGRTPEELVTSDEFFRDIVTGPFERLTQASFITQLDGQEYMRKVSENCIAFWKSIGAYVESEAKAIERMIEVFKQENFPPGSSIFFTHLNDGSYVISFSKDTKIPQVENAVIQNNHLGEAVLETIIGKNGVSPATRQSMAARLAPLMNKINDASIGNGKRENEAKK